MNGNHFWSNITATQSVCTTILEMHFDNIKRSEELFFKAKSMCYDFHCYHAGNLV